MCVCVCVAGLESIIKQTRKRRGEASTEASDVASWLKERMASPSGAGAGAGSKDGVSSWLKLCKLDRYSSAVAKEGYDEIVFIQVRTACA